jgi:hypothetical protein
MDAYVADRKTTDAQIRKARAVARRVKEETGLFANVDDWGRFGNFQIVVDVYEDSHRGVYKIGADLRSLTRTIKKIVQEADGVHLDADGIEHPKPVYDRSSGESRKLGYDRHYTMFHVRAH